MGQGTDGEMAAKHNGELRSCSKQIPCHWRAPGMAVGSWQGLDNQSGPPWSGWTQAASDLGWL